MKILLGPFQSNEMSRAYLRGFCDHDVRTFSPGDADIRYAHPTSTFHDVLAALPAGWAPDFVIFLFPEFSCLLPGIEDCPYPTVLLVSDWHAGYDAVERVCAMFDVVVADRRGAERLRLTSGARVLARPLYGYDPEVHRRLDLEPVWDLSMVADLDPNVHKERVRLLTRLAMLGERWRVQFFTGMMKDAYAQHVNQSRITFNRTVRGEMNMRCYEVPACGSLLLCERGNGEIGDYLEDGRECVLYGEDDLEAVAERFLLDEAKRREIAEAGWRRIQPYTYRQRMNALVSELEGLRPGLRPFRLREAGARHAARARQACCTWDPHVGRRAVVEAQAALRFAPHEPGLLNTLGCAAARAADEAADAQARADWLRMADDALAEAGAHGVVPLLNHAHLLVTLGRHEEARVRLHAALEEGLPLGDTEYWPRRFDRFLCEWERHPLQRGQLALWRVRDLLADLEPEAREAHLRAAVALRPDIGVTWHRLALTLAEASPERGDCLRRALEADGLALPARYDLIRWLWPRSRHDALALARRTALAVAAFPFADTELAKVTGLVQSLAG